MNKFRKHLLIGVTVLGLGSSAFIANAQTGAGEQGDRASMGGHRWHGGVVSPERMKEKIAKRQAELHEQLKLSAGQESAWQNFVAAMTPADMGKRPDRAEWEKLSSPERMERQLALMKEREAHMASRLAATKTFYAALTPEQQKTFDENFMRGGHRHGRS